MKKIAVFTGSRAEYGLMRNLVLNLQKDIYFDLDLLISGTHMNPDFGSTINEIKSDGVNNIHLIPNLISTQEKVGMCLYTAETIKQISSVLKNLETEWLIILGDRFESFGAATAGHLLGLKNIHLHGGETSLGSLDDKLRNAISQLSTFHFTSLEAHKKKVEAIIGTSNNVYNVGPMVIDGLVSLKCLKKEEFEKKTGFIFSENNFLITFHPETLSKDYGIQGFQNLLKVLEIYDCNILFTAPNADLGSSKILELINKFISKTKNKSLYIPSLGQELYLNAIVLFDCIMGNSSSGIIEAPLMNKKVLNIGDRQKGRNRFGQVFDVGNDFVSINKAVKKIVNNNYLKGISFSDFKEMHKKNTPSRKIINILKNIP